MRQMLVRSSLFAFELPGAPLSCRLLARARCAGPFGFFGARNGGRRVNEDHSRGRYSYHFRACQRPLDPARFRVHRVCHETGLVVIDRRQIVLAQRLAREQFAEIVAPRSPCAILTGRTRSSDQSFQKSLNRPAASCAYLTVC